MPMLEIIKELARKRRPEPVITIHFDGVLSKAKKRSRVSDIELIDEPVEGSIEFILDLLSKQGIIIAIYDTRSKYLSGRRAMKRWLEHHGGLHFLNAIPEEHKRCYTQKPHVHQDTLISRWIQAGYPYEKRLHSDSTGYLVRDNEHLHAGRWLVKQIYWPAILPESRIILGPRNYHFEGNEWPDIDQLINFSPWYRRR